MTEQVATGAFCLRYWQPTDQVEIGCQVTGVPEVVAHADRAARVYRAQGADCLAGVSLWRGADSPENSLSLAIGPPCWAIVHTDAEFFQTVTRGPRSPERTPQKVRFDDLLEIPSDCFIDRALAIDTVSLWMTEDALLQAAGFSDDLFG
ncbi:hypothetical protein [Streptomyces sp. NBC_01320]|uniref:hypothetical protein n=1 Tax=Streptomyces sp. NBC_01320 TaxID=2903824 RepID=UPI002E12C85A|nr:hypothetical protein OG395_56315 [Streptomyces sp. NBC_01320]